MGNLGLLFMYAAEQEFDEIDLMIRQFQQTVMRVRYSSIPVVLAPHGLSLGGGCEMTLHADRVQAAAETYMGLVEVGVGLIPGGGGTKEMALRVSQKLEAGDIELNSLQNAFMNIATAKVSTSGYEAFDMGILQHGDQISVNKTPTEDHDHALAERGDIVGARIGRDTRGRPAGYRSEQGFLSAELFSRVLENRIGVFLVVRLWRGRSSGCGRSGFLLGVLCQRRCYKR